MSKTVADVMKLVQENEVKFVDFRFTDTRGKEQHVSVPVSHFDEDKFVSGHAFDGSSIAGWKGIEASDMLLMPDPNTANIDPFFEEPTLILSCDVVEPGDGKPYERDPRSLAKRAEAYLKSSGIGDAAYPDELRERFTKTSSDAADVIELATFLAERASAPVTAVGSCAGAWLSARTAAHSRSLHRIVMVNNATWRDSTKRQEENYAAWLDEQASLERDDGDAAPEESRGLIPLIRRIPYMIPHHLPYAVLYQASKRLGLAEHAEVLLGEIPAQTSVLLEFGAEDWQWFRDARGELAMPRLVKQGMDLTAEVDPRLDHSLLSKAAADA